MKKRVLTLIAAVIAIILCSALFIACSNADPDEQSKNPEHKHSYIATVIDPTCTEQGYTLHKCSCNDEYKDTYVNALGHNYVGGVCTRCNKQEGTPDPVDPEDPVDPDHEHSYTATVIDPTCTEQGYTLHKCSCGDEYKDTYTNALNHLFTNYISDNNATCSKDCTKTAVCDRSGCDAKDTVDIPDSKNNIHTDNGNGVCSDCGQTIVYSDGLSFELNDDEESYYVKGIGDCEDTEISIPAFYNGLPVTSIGEGAFRDCTELTGITISNSVTSIGEDVFSGCNNIENIYYTGNIAGWCSISGLLNIMLYGKSNKNLYINDSKIEGDLTMPDSVTSIGNFAFYECTGLTSITIPDSVTSIGDGAFRGCTGLTSVTIGNSVTSIGGCAFYGCTGLTNITIPDSVTELDADAFNGCSKLSSITIGKGMKRIRVGSFSRTHIENIYYAGDIAGWCGISGLEHFMGFCSINKNLYINGSKVEGDLIIPNGVTSIENSAFYRLTGLTSVTIPNSVTSIGGCAFYGCTGLTSITIPDSVTYIGKWTFEGCTKLTSVTIGNSVTRIGIDKWAFDECDRLTSVYYKGTESEWNNKVSIYSDNTSLTSATRYYYSETHPTGEGNYWHYDTDGVTPVAW